MPGRTRSSPFYPAPEIVREMNSGAGKSSTGPFLFGVHADIRTFIRSFSMEMKNSKKTINPKNESDYYE